MAGGEFFTGVGASSYDLDIALRLDIEDTVVQLDPFDAPFTNGTGNGPILPKGTVSEVKYEWLEDELLQPRSTLSAAYATTDTSFTVATGDGPHFRADDLVDVGNGATYRVTSVSGDTVNIEVWTGTDAAASSGDEIQAIGTLPQEGADPGDFRARDRSRPYNLTMIFGPEPIEMTETELVVRKYGVANEWAYQLSQRSKELVQKFEQAILYSVRNDDSTNRRRSFGGLNYWITTNEDSSTTAISYSAIRTLAQDCWTNGGNPQFLALGAAQKVKVSDFSSSDVRLERDDKVRGSIVDYVDSDFGRIYVVLHRWIRGSDAFLFNPTQAEIPSLRPMSFEMLAKTGDRRQGMVVAEKGFKFRAEKHAGKFSALAA